MVLLHSYPIVTLIFLWLQTSLEARDSSLLCPIGFQLAFTRTKREPICYRLKGPEKLSDTYRDCAGNLYNIELFIDLNINNSGFVLWTQYKTSYAGGPFVDWSYTDSRGKLLDTKSLEIFSANDDDTDDLCLLLNSDNTFVTRECNRDTENYRYCFVKPYSDERNLSEKGCEDLKNSSKMSSPIPICLATLNGIRGGPVRATWTQSEKMCKDNGGALLNRGWIYSNIPWFNTSGPPGDPEYPLGIIYNPNHTLRNAANNGGLIPSSEWKFAETNFPNETSYGSVNNSIWHLVNSSHIFYHIVCEKPVNLKVVDMHVKVDEGNIIALLTNDSNSIDEKHISCFTDSETFHPTPVKIKRKYNNKFILKPIDDGYYWCIVTDSVNYVPTESNKALFIRVEESLSLRYAVEIALDNAKYNIDTIEKVDSWRKKLQEYIYYYTVYTKLKGKLDENLDFVDKEMILKDFKDKHSDLEGKEKDIIFNVKFKKVSRDLMSILVHLELKSMMIPVPPGSWNGIRVTYMKPVHYCSHEGHRFYNTLTVNCVTYNCSGNFNDGVNIVMTETQSCVSTLSNARALQDIVTVAMPTIGTLPSPTHYDSLYRDTRSDSSEESTERVPKPKPTTESVTEYYDVTSTTIDYDGGQEVTTVVDTWYPTPDPTEVITVNTPTRPPPQVPTSTQRPILAPEDQLQQVIQDLESLINNQTAVVSVDDISNAFDQVDELLDYNMEVEIPGDLLQLLDGLGARVELNGAEEAVAVRSNIALLVADAEPELPVRGLRIAARDTEEFTENAFNIIRQDVNASFLESDRSEVVVQLPESVATSSRRISFVVFRNNRAFPGGGFSINSRVLSVNVENLTHFDSNEVVDLHFAPLVGDPNRNESRACAYWHFENDGTGYWSQEGCTFIQATTPGTLDTCRCDHLTHFAEILIPKAVFSERNESVLEVLTVIGCCLSIIGLVAVGLTALLFRSWRRDFSNKIWLQLCISIFLLVLCFLIVIFAKFDTYNIPCMLIGVVLHYSVLASFCWMLVAAVLSYRRLVLVFNRDTSHKLLKAAAFAWGAPCAVVGVLLSVDPHSYAGRFEEKTPTGAFCYPSGLALWLAVFTPIIIMLLANWVLFVLIVRSVFASRRVQRHGDSHNEALRCASVSCLLVFLFGLPWIFGPFSFNVVAAYFFTITATFQGFILFLFFVLGNKKTRDLWLNKLKIRQTRKVPVTSSTYTNRSTGTSARMGDPASVESKMTKPKSLVAPDSRFS